jgi:branched-chain amino acid transport system substrate-binding protein
MNIRQLINVLVAASCLAASGAHATQVVVVQSGPMTGLDATQGRAYAAGMQLLFDSVNKGGGVNGHTITLVRKDDGGRAEDTISNTRDAIAQDKAMVLAGYFGNQNIDGLVKSGVLEKEKIALVGYRAAEVRAETPGLYNVRASLRDEINKLTEHLATIGITRLGLFYEEGPGAATLVTAAEQAAQKANATIIARSSYPLGTARVTAAVDLFVKTPPQAILMVSSGAAAAAFIEEYRGAGGAAQLFSHSGADIEQLSKRLSEEQMQGVAIAQVTPSPYKISNRIAKEFSDTVAKAGKLEVPVSYAMMEGYIAGSVIVEAARRMGPRISREGFANALDTVDVDLGGYKVGFKPGMRSGSRFVELSIVTATGRIRQ